MGDIVVNEFLYFVHNKYGTVPNEKLLSCLAGFYDEAEVVAAKSVLFDAAKKCLADDKLPRLVNHPRKGGNKVKMDCEDIVSLYALMDREKVAFPKIYSENLERIPAIQASDVDLVNILTEMAALKNTVKKMCEDIGVLKATSGRTLSVAGGQEGGSTWVQNYQPARVALPQQGMSNAQVDGRSYAAAANAQPGSSYRQSGGANGMQVRGVTRKQPVIGTKSASASDGVIANRLKASDVPRPFDLYVGNLDVDSTAEQVKENLMLHKLRVLSCDIVRSSRFTDVRSVAAHVVLDARDKDKAFNPEFWPSDLTVRPWRHARRSKDSWSALALGGDGERRRRESFGNSADDDA
jgi:hypothetical protein